MAATLLGGFSRRGGTGGKGDHLSEQGFGVSDRVGLLLPANPSGLWVSHVLFQVFSFGWFVLNFLLRIFTLTVVGSWKQEGRLWWEGKSVPFVFMFVEVQICLTSGEEEKQHQQQGLAVQSSDPTNGP